MDFTDINKNLPDGENMGGLTQTVIYGLWDDVSVWPTAPATPADTEANAAWVGDIVMKPGRRAYTFYSTDDTCELRIRKVGITDGLSVEMRLSVFNPGLKKKILGFVAAAKNENLFFIAKDNESQNYLMGDSRRAVKMVPSDGIRAGRLTADRKGATLSFVFKTNTPRVYTGDMTSLLEAAESFTADSTLITSDSTIITADQI